MIPALVTTIALVAGLFVTALLGRASLRFDR
jgi:hypothetical protein